MDAGTERVLAGRYRLGRRLGRGGMGTVWFATDLMLDRNVAVKELSVNHLPEEDLAIVRSRMQQEARAAARIRHPGVITVHDVLEQDGRPWIVMELVDGRSLAEVVEQEGVLAPREAARIGAQVLAALDQGHRAGVIHRDVKPANVLLERGTGRVVLTDFGIATYEGDSALTRTGDLVGSPDYLAPERVHGGRPGPESDLWGLGATLYAAVEGQSPFRRESPITTLAAVVADPLPEPRRAGALAPVLRQLMAKEPGERPSAADAIRALEDIAAGHTTAFGQPGALRTPTLGVPVADRTGAGGGDTAGSGAGAGSGADAFAAAYTAPMEGAQAGTGTGTDAGSAAGGPAGFGAMAGFGPPPSVAERPGYGSAPVVGTGYDSAGSGHGSATAAGGTGGGAAGTVPTARMPAEGRYREQGPPQGRRQAPGQGQGQAPQQYQAQPVAAGRGGGADAAGTRGPRRRGRRVLTVAVTALVVGALAAGGGYTWRQRHGDRDAHAGTTTAATSRPAARASAAVTAGSQALPPDYRMVHDPDGFSLPLPTDGGQWVRTDSGGMKAVNYSPDGGLHRVVIGVTPSSATTPLKHAQALAADIREKDSSYQQIALGSNTFDGTKGAQLEFTFDQVMPDGTVQNRHEIEQFYLDPKTGTEYDFFLDYPDSDWQHTGFKRFLVLLKYFRADDS